MGLFSRFFFQDEVNIPAMFDIDKALKSRSDLKYKEVGGTVMVEYDASKGVPTSQQVTELVNTVQDVEDKEVQEIMAVFRDQRDNHDSKLEMLIRVLVAKDVISSSSVKLILASPRSSAQP